MKPCPFCGSTNVGCFFNDPFHAVACNECGGIGGMEMKRDEAIAKWNSRVDSLHGTEVKP